MLEPTTAAGIAAAGTASEPGPPQITDQLGRLIPLVNGNRRVATIAAGAELTGLPSLLSWDADGQLSID